MKFLISRLFLAVFLVSLSLSAAAAGLSSIPLDKISPAKGERRVFAVMTLGLDVRGELDEEQNSVFRQKPAMAMGLGYASWLGLLEYGQLTGDPVGNSALSLRKISEDVMLWGQWIAEENWTFKPFFGFGLGAQRESAETKLYQSIRRDDGVWRELYGAAFGIRLADLSPLWISLEGRVLYGQGLEPSPTVGGMLRFGFVLE